MCVLNLGVGYRLSISLVDLGHRGCLDNRCWVFLVQNKGGYRDVRATPAALATIKQATDRLGGVLTHESVAVQHDTTSGPAFYKVYTNVQIVWWTHAKGVPRLIRRDRTSASTAFVALQCGYGVAFPGVRSHGHVRFELVSSRGVRLAVSPPLLHSLFQSPTIRYFI